jgi:uncharacterized protein (DUF2141 family)
LEPKDTAVFQEFPLLNGGYLFSAFQEASDNQKLDYRLFGFPKELIEMSYYYEKAIPQNLLTNKNTS